MVKSIKVVKLQENCEKVFDIITDNKNYSWRTDISKIEIISDAHFVEHTKDGYKTDFYITNTIPNKRYEFDLKNDNMTGHFIAELRQINTSNMELKLIEQIEVKNIIMKLFAKSYLKKQQENYVKNLQVALEKQK